MLAGDGDNVHNLFLCNDLAGIPHVSHPEMAWWRFVVAVWGFVRKMWIPDAAAWGSELGDETDAGDEEDASENASGVELVGLHAEPAEVVDEERGDEGGGDGEADEGAGANLVDEGETGVDLDGTD